MLIKHKQQYTKKLMVTGIFIIIVFSLFYCFDYLLQISISVFLPRIKNEFSINNFQLGLIGSVFFISYVIMQIPSGYLIDEYGAKKIAIVMALACAIGSIIMYLSSSFYLLLLSRLIIGFGSSAAFLCAIYIISQWAPKNYFSIFVGILQALAGFGAIFGQAPIAYINNFFTWNEIYLGFSLIAFIFVIFFIVVIGKSINIPHKKIGFDFSKSSINTYLLILKNKELIKLSILGFIAWSPVASLAGFWIIPFLSGKHGSTTLDSSYIVTTFWIGMILGSLLIPIVSEYLKRRIPILIAGFIIQFISFVLICVYGNISETLICIAMFLLGIVSPIQGFCIVIANDIYKGKGFGIATGLLNMFGALSGGVLQLLVGFLLSYVFLNSKYSYQFSFLIYAALALIAILISVRYIKESHPKYVNNAQ